MTNFVLNDTLDEKDWIQVVDESSDSIFEELAPLAQLSLHNGTNASGCDVQSFRVTDNGSFVFKDFAKSIKRTGIQKSCTTIKSQSDSDSMLEECLLVRGQVGRGGSATVYKAVDTRTNEIFAVKKMYVDRRQNRRQFLQELLALYRFGDADDYNVVKLIDAFAFANEQAVGLVFEFMDCSLQTIIDGGGVQDEAALAYISRECLRGLSHLHNQRRIIHRDIKPSNILLNSRGRIKLADFGLAKGFLSDKSHSSTFVGTLNFMAPERINGAESYDYSSDVFSLGLTIYSVAIGKTPAKRYWDLLSERTGKQEPLFKEGEKWSAQFQNFVSLCLRIGPSERPDTDALLNHKWIVDLSNDQIDEGMKKLSTVYKST